MPDCPAPVLETSTTIPNSNARIIKRLKNRQDFLKVAKNGMKWVTPSIIMQALIEKKSDLDNTIYVGYTVSRVVGNAVTRNRVRRRLKAAAGKILRNHTIDRQAIVIVGRKAAITRPFEFILQDLKLSIKGINANLAGSLKDE